MSDNILTAKKLSAMWDDYLPVLLYGTDEFIERGKLMLVPASDMNPEFIVLHPADLDEMTKKLNAFRLVHLRDEPQEDFKERLRRWKPAAAGNETEQEE